MFLRNTARVERVYRCTKNIFQGLNQSDRLSSTLAMRYSIMRMKGSHHGYGIPGRKGFEVGRVSPAYEQLVYAHCGREDTLRKCLELSHVRDQPRQVYRLRKTFCLSGVDLLVLKRQHRFKNIYRNTTDNASIFLLCESNN